jgi:hypothetical protein
MKARLVLFGQVCELGNNGTALGTNFTTSRQRINDEAKQFVLGVCSQRVLTVLPNAKLSDRRPTGRVDRDGRVRVSTP